MSAIDIAADFIRRHEGCVLTAYQDQAGVWTIGYGATGPDVKEGVVWTLQQAEDRLAADLKRFAIGVQQLVHLPLTDKQAAALMSFAFNLGGGALGESTLLRLLNDGHPLDAAHEFPRWDHAAGKENKGLLIRRFHEAALFLEGTP